MQLRSNCSMSVAVALISSVISCWSMWGISPLANGHGKFQRGRATQRERPP
ncbi:hypothetical protein [Lysobacter gummosus]|uniref:hypothetical protein n=1 Tax=Lysobacter gummosus TaxID=262324 RepID=UPI003641BD13